jgi:hypothetical protein
MVRYVAAAKLWFWHFRHALYTGIRRFALAMMICVFAVTVLFMAAASKLPTRTGKPTFKHDIFYAGVFSPANMGGLSSMRQVQEDQDQHNCHFNIVSLYIPWGDEARCLVPGPLMDSIYDNGSYPMITWEPWGALFRDDSLRSDHQLLSRITAGAYDPYLQKFTAGIKALNRPVFLRFAHEADNPSYPWSTSGGNTPETFKNAWRYVHDFFVRRGVYNAVWVWNPWKADHVAAYFPGARYVDWLGVTILNYGKLNDDGRYYSFKELYAPFHRLPLFRSDMPVMIAEAGSLRGEGNQDLWLNNALSVIEKEMKEVKALVLFNSAVDRNVPGDIHRQALNWQPDTPGVFFTAMAWYHARKWHGLSAPYRPMPVLAAYTPALNKVKPKIRMSSGIRGVNYEKGQHWYRNLHALTRRTVIKDFTAMKQLGINTVKRHGPGVYDRNVLAAARQLNMKVHYSFGPPDVADLTTAQEKLSRSAKEIVATVKKWKNDSSIIAWNIGDTLWQQLGDRFYKPTLVYQQEAYAAWLRQLIAGIRAVDTVRPITMDLRVNKGLTALVERLQREVPEVDAFGLIIPDDTSGLSQISSLQAPWFISQADIAAYAALPDKGMPVFLQNWQDIGDRDYLTFDGLIDHWGRHKPTWQLVEKHWAHRNAAATLPPVKILRPAALTQKDSRLTYHAIVEQQEKWQLATATRWKDLSFEWYLIRTDQWGNPVMMEHAGNGPALQLTIPENPAHCRLYLVAVKGNDVVTTQSLLNIPLLYKNGKPH